MTMFVCEDRDCRWPELIVSLPYDMDPDGLGAIVYRDGQPSNRWGDGTVGLPGEADDYIDDATEARCPEGHDAYWTVKRSVYISPDQEADEERRQQMRFD